MDRPHRTRRRAHARVDDPASRALAGRDGESAPLVARRGESATPREGGVVGRRARVVPRLERRRARPTLARVMVGGTSCDADRRASLVVKGCSSVNYVKGGGWRREPRRRPKCIERSIALDARRLGACHASCAAARAEAAGVPPPSRTLALHHPPPPRARRPAAWCGHGSGHPNHRHVRPGELNRLPVGQVQSSYALCVCRIRPSKKLWPQAGWRSEWAAPTR